MACLLFALRAITFPPAGSLCGNMINGFGLLFNIETGIYIPSVQCKSQVRTAILGLLSSLKDGQSVTINVEAQRSNAGGNEWILYNGTVVTVYGGKVGDVSTPLYLFKGTSGNGDFQNSKYQGEKDRGPTPEGKWRVNLVPDPNRIAGFDKGELISSKEGGIEAIPQSVPERYNENVCWKSGVPGGQG